MQNSLQSRSTETISTTTGMTVSILTDSSKLFLNERLRLGSFVSCHCNSVISVIQGAPHRGDNDICGVEIVNITTTNFMHPIQIVTLSMRNNVETGLMLYVIGTRFKTPA